MKQFKVGILLFNEVEVLDFASPFEGFSITCELPPSNHEILTTKVILMTREEEKRIMLAGLIQHYRASGLSGFQYKINIKKGKCIVQNDMFSLYKVS